MQNVSLELPWNSSEINLIQTLPLKKKSYLKLHYILLTENLFYKTKSKLSLNITAH